MNPTFPTLYPHPSPREEAALVSLGFFWEFGSLRKVGICGFRRNSGRAWGGIVVEESAGGSGTDGRHGAVKRSRDWKNVIIGMVNKFTRTLLRQGIAMVTAQKKSGNEEGIDRGWGQSGEGAGSSPGFPSQEFGVRCQPCPAARGSELSWDEAVGCSECREIPGLLRDPLPVRAGFELATKPSSFGLPNNLLKALFY